MSQEQPRRPQDDGINQEPIKYKDAFGIKGGIAGQTVASSRDAAVMQSAENRMVGQILQKGSPAASVMRSVANKTENPAHVAQADMSSLFTDKGRGIPQTDLSGRKSTSESAMKSESPTKKAVCHEEQSAHPAQQSENQQAGGITIGEALEATALTSGSRPVDYSDAAAIQAAEVRATGRTNIIPGGVAAAAQSAATRNARATRDEDKTKLGEILADASSKLPADKPVTRRDAEGVIGAELRNDPNLCTHPGGVAASVAAAARLNQSNMMQNRPSNNP